MVPNYKILLAFLLMIGLSVSAQEKWTLNECVAYALDHNLQLNDFEYTSQSGRETYRQSVRDLLPRINGSADYIINFGRSIDPFTNNVVATDFFSNRYSLESSIDLFRGFQKLNTIKATKLLYEATKEETLQQKYLLAFRVMQAFYDVQFYEGLVAISKEQLAVSESNHKLVEKQIELGLKAGSDLYEAESLLLTDKLNLTQSRNQLATAKLKLIQEMNLENVEDIAIIKEFPSVTLEGGAMAIQADSIFAEAQGFIPILKAQELRVKAAQKQLAASRGSLLPSLSLFAGIGTGYFETTRDSLGATVLFKDQFGDNTSQYIGISLNIPISNGWSVRSRIKQQKIEHSRAENNLEIQEQVIFQAIQALVQEYHALRVEYEQSAQKMEAQNLAFTIAQKRYEKGLINALELYTAKNLFASAQNENLQVGLKSEINKSTLDFYRGLPVFGFD